MMTRKHFETIAKILNRYSCDYAIINDFADYLANENPRFDKQKFIEACVVKA